MQETDSSETDLNELPLDERAKSLEVIIDELEGELEAVSSRPPSSPQT